MKKYYYILLFTISIGTKAQTNESTKLPEMMPRNPQASQFTRYGDIPIGKYSGTLDLSIPIHTIEAKGLKIPISLSYQSNGIKVTEEAGWAGLGWSLDAGGSIIQNVIGTDDYGYYKRRIYPDFDCMLAHQSPVSGGTAWNANTPFFLQQTIPTDYAAFQNCLLDPKYATGEFDTSPDKFTFTFLGYSGDFYLDWKTGKFECTTNKNILITSEDSNPYNLPNTIVISVPEGHRFLFELKEETQAIANSSMSETGGIPSSIDITNQNEKISRVYKLTQIITNQADLINFGYVTTEYSKNLPVISQSHTAYKRSIIQPDNGFPFRDGEVVSRFIAQQKYSYLTSISYGGGTVNFTLSDRIDLKEAKKVDKIEILNNKGQHVKDFNFSYSYFIGHSSGTNWDNYLNIDSHSSGKTQNELTHRLRLDSLKEEGLNPYIFTYNQETLPKKTSYATDYWGCYNGYSQNESFFPNIYQFNIERDNPIFYKHSNNNKSPRLQYSKSAILEKITYPTGGYTGIEWEMNSFDNFKVPDFSQGAVQNYINLTTQPGANNRSQSALIIEGGNTILKGSAFLSTRGCTDPNAYSNCYVRIQGYKKELITYVKNHPGYSQYGLMYVLGVSGLLNGSNQTLYNQYINTDTYLQKAYNDPEEKTYSGLTYNMPEGIVVFSVSGGCGTYNGTTNSSMANIVLNYRDYKPLTSEASIGAGLRIKSITSATGFLSYASKKTYSYSGGKIMSPLVFYNKSKFDYYWEIRPTPNILEIGNFNGHKYVLSSNSFVSPSSDAMGRHVGYDKVVETPVSVDLNSIGTTNGEIAEHFHNTPVMAASTGAGAYTDIAIPLSKEFPLNGQLKKQEVFDKLGQINKRVSYLYAKKINDVNWAMKINQTGNMYDFISGIMVFYPRYLIGVYPIISQQSLLIKQTSEEFFPNTNTILTEIKEMTYDTNNQLSYEKKSRSDGSLQEMYYSYPYNFNNTDIDYQVLNQMSLSNMITPIIESTIKIDSELISKERKKYSRKLLGNGYQYPDIFNLTSAKVTKSNQTDGDEINYTLYDSKCNLLEILYKGKYTCYIWGYNDTLPIAKIEDTQYTSIPQNLLAEAQAKSNTGTESDLIVALGNLRNGMPNAMVTTCTYKPLFGVSTIMDAKGNKMSYDYDNAGRLKTVRDKDNNILSENEYHYKP
ncbi:hypothetical protein [Flavobacterium lindanitolerans]|jgi:YD repeat-containing protein|uniref:hypothetical protein n=1 Tax=Flavobacterium lindanitolerans TaxID=428988 RepID=UPI0023F167D9|nr:hypothetical protein [Flavobacterium lindanitolerans]